MRATASGLSTAAGLLVTAERSGLVLLDATATGDRTWYPHAQAEDSSGIGLGYTSAATPPIIPTKVPVAAERIKVQVASGGSASAGDGLKGTLHLYMSGF